MDNEKIDTGRYWDDRLRKNWGVQGTGFIGLSKAWNNWLTKIKRKVFFRALTHLRGDLDLHKARVLDIGPGTGVFVDLWKEVGVYSLIGVDISSFAVEQLSKKYSDCKFIVADISDFSTVDQLAPDGPFNIISAFEILFHIIDDERYERAFQSVKHLLKPGGYFIFSDNLLHGTRRDSNTQVSRSIEMIQRIMKTNGFETIWRGPAYVLMNTPVDSRNPLHWLFWNTIRLTLKHLGNFAGNILGALLYPLEIQLTGSVHEGPSTEVVVCRLLKP